VTSDVEMLGCGVGPTLHDFTHESFKQVIRPVHGVKGMNAN
jgi:hypothetical protein